jgi:hypothetical protein
LAHVGQGDLLVMGIVLWVASLACVVLTLVQGEAFEGHTTLALCACLLIPWLFVSGEDEAPSQRSTRFPLFESARARKAARADGVHRLR